MSALGEQFDNTCTYCKRDQGESEIQVVSECEHFIGTDQCWECPTNQACFDCCAARPGLFDRVIRGVR